MANILLLEDKLAKVMNNIKNSVPMDFGSWEDGDDEYATIERACINAGLQYDEFSVSCGASKVVACINGCDSVLKVPYSGVWCYQCEEVDEETGEVIQEEDEFFEPFCGAENSENNTDYCLSEFEKYIALKEAGLEMFFPKTEIFGECESGYVLKQEKVITWYDAKEKQSSEDSKNKAKNNYFDFGAPKAWIALAIDWYGEELVNKLVKYCKEVDGDIDSDLHYNNIGFNKEGAPIILDFSGFSN